MEEKDQPSQPDSDPQEKKQPKPAKSFRSPTKNLVVAGTALGLFLILFLVFLFLPSKSQEQKPTASQKEAEIAPEKHLTELIQNNLTEYYRPPIVQPVQEKEKIWEYQWGIDEEDALASVAYNQNNDYLNRRVIITKNKSIQDEVEFLTPKLASDLTEDIYKVSSDSWECDELTAELTADPKEGEAPLEDVDLTAEISGDSKKKTTYAFDCESDSQWDLTTTTNQTTFTAENLCNYPENKEYSARVKVIHDNIVIIDSTDPAPKTISYCRSSWVEENQKYELTLAKFENSQNLGSAFCIRNPKSSDYEKNTCINY